jgi:hypothetical protein
MDHMRKTTTAEKRARYDAFMKWKATMAERAAEAEAAKMTTAPSIDPS